jgi:hypothetical protein
MDHESERHRYNIPKWFLLPSGHCALALILALLIVFPQVAHAQAENADSSMALLFPGAIEIGIGGSLVVISGITNASMMLRGGSFVAVPAGLAGVELGLAYGHVSFLDRVDIESRFCWLFPLQGSSTLPFIGIGGGLRKEWMGTFSQTRYPMGGGVGIRALLGADVVIRSEYVYRYVAGDPVANYSEHKLEFGLSLLLNNDRDSQPGVEQ